MPDYGSEIGNRLEVYSAGATFIRADNTTHTISLDAVDNITKDECDDWASAIGACSNAGLYSNRTASSWERPDRSSVLVYDEAGKDAVFVFQDAKYDNKIQYVMVPDLDASLYDSASIDLTAGEIPELISRTITILNKQEDIDPGAFAPDYKFVKAYLKRGREKTHVTFPSAGVDIEEPTAVGDPGRDPASEV